MRSGNGTATATATATATQLELELELFVCGGSCRGNMSRNDRLPTSTRRFLAIRLSAPLTVRVLTLTLTPFSSIDIVILVRPAETRHREIRVENKTT